MPGLKQLQKYSSLGIPTTTLATFAPGTIIRVDRIAMHEDYESGNRLYLFGQIHGNASFTDINLNNVFRFGESRSDFLGPGGERVTCE